MNGCLLAGVIQRLPKNDDGSVNYEDICEIFGYDPDCPQTREAGHDGVCFPQTEDLTAERKDEPVRLFFE